MMYDVRADHERNTYSVVERETGRVVAVYRYKARSESSRGIAHGRANVCRHRLINEARRQEARR